MSYPKELRAILTHSNCDRDMNFCDFIKVQTSAKELQDFFCSKIFFLKNLKRNITSLLKSATLTK